MIEAWKHYHVYDPNVITPTFQRPRTRRKMNQIQLLRPGDGVLRYDFLTTTLNRQTCAMRDQDVEIGPQVE